MQPSFLKNNKCNVCRVIIADRDIFCEVCDKLPYYPDKYVSSEERLLGITEDNSEFYTMDDD
jgi:hypothetical protein